MERKIRVIIAKESSHCDYRGAKVIAAAFRDAGIEVIYLGLRQTPEMIVEAALQEDADAIGISILSGAHMTVFKKILEVMQAKKLENVLLFGGGIIQKRIFEKLKNMGVKLFSGTSFLLTETIDYVKKWVAEHRTLEV